MNSFKRLSKQERRSTLREARQLARELAESIESMHIARYEIEKLDKGARALRERIRSLQVTALGFVDKREKARASRMLENAEDEVNDRIFALSELRSKARRSLRKDNELKERVEAVQRKLQQKDSENA